MMKTLLTCLVLLSGCAINRYAGKDLAASGSPCIDGVLVNMDYAGCEMFYFGTIPHKFILKMRCTYSPEENMWTQSTFYAVPLTHPPVSSSWKLFCTDRLVDMYVFKRVLKKKTESKK